MSGRRETYVSISRREINRLRDQAKRSDYQASRNRRLEQQQKAKDRRLLELDRVIRLQDERAERYNQRIDSLGEDIREMERENHLKFQDQRTEYRGMINDVNIRVDQVAGEIKAQRREYLDLFEKQSRYFHRALQDQGEKLQKNIDTLAQNLKARFNNQDDIAREWYKIVGDEIAFIKKNYRYQQFTPGELEEIERNISTAQKDIQTGIPQSAITECRHGYRDARKLREKLEILESEWDYLYQFGNEAVETTLANIEDHRKYELIMNQFDDQSTELDVEYWSDGDWSKLRDNVAGYKEGLNNEKTTLQIEDLKEIIYKSDAADNKLSQIDEDAKSRLIASIKRSDIQEQIRERLEEFGYTMAERTCEGEDGKDFRGSHYLKMRNGNDEEIITIVSPETESEGLKNKLSINFYDKSPNEAIRNERITKIESYLKQEGIDVAPSQCVPQYEHKNAPEELRNFEQIRKQSAVKNKI